MRSFKKSKVISKAALKILVGTLLLGLVSSSFAVQSFNVDNNSKVTLKISNADYNRIFVAGDRISDVNGVKGQYNLKVDNKQGQIYISPSQTNQTTPFNIFITTESGNNYQLQLIPLPMPAATVELKPLLLKNPAAKAWEENSPYKTAIIKLQTAMYNYTPLAGYSIRVIKKCRTKPLGDIAAIKLQIMYIGDHLRGNLYEITNRTSHTLRLRETQLYRPNALAIGLETRYVEPHGKTRLFVITKNGD